MSRPLLAAVLWLLLILGGYRHEFFQVHAPERGCPVAVSTASMAPRARLASPD